MEILTESARTGAPVRGAGWWRTQGGGRAHSFNWRVSGEQEHQAEGEDELDCEDRVPVRVRRPAFLQGALFMRTRVPRCAELGARYTSQRSSSLLLLLLLLLGSRASAGVRAAVRGRVQGRAEGGSVAAGETHTLRTKPERIMASISGTSLEGALRPSSCLPVRGSSERVLPMLSPSEASLLLLLSRLIGVKLTFMAVRGGVWQEEDGALPWVLNTCAIGNWPRDSLMSVGSDETPVVSSVWILVLEYSSTTISTYVNGIVYPVSPMKLVLYPLLEYSGIRVHVACAGAGRAIEDHVVADGPAEQQLAMV